MYYGFIKKSTRQEFESKRTVTISAQIAKFMGPTWGPPGSCRPQMGPMLASWTLLLYVAVSICHSYSAQWSQPNRSSKSISFATISSTTQHIEAREQMTRPSPTRLKSFVRLNLLYLTDYQYPGPHGMQFVNGVPLYLMIPGKLKLTHRQLSLNTKQTTMGIYFGSRRPLSWGRCFGDRVFPSKILTRVTA